MAQTQPRSKRRTLLIFAVPLLCLLGTLAGSAVLWITLGDGGLSADVAEVLATNDQPQPTLSCHMAARSRMGYCLFESDEGGVQQIAGRLGLESLTDTDESLRIQAYLIGQATTGCLSADGLGSAESLPAYWIAGRPAQLALNNGGQFEYLLLLHNPATRQVCVQVAYAYG